MNVASYFEIWRVAPYFVRGSSVLIGCGVAKISRHTATDTTNYSSRSYKPSRLFRFLRSQHATIGQPFNKSLGPSRCSAGFGIVAITKAVTGIGEQMQFGGHAGFFVFQV
jgi:hypothetical protein